MITFPPGKKDKGQVQGNYRSNGSGIDPIRFSSENMFGPCDFLERNEFDLKHQ